MSEYDHAIAKRALEVSKKLKEIKEQKEYDEELASLSPGLRYIITRPDVKEKYIKGWKKPNWLEWSDVLSWILSLSSLFVTINAAIGGNSANVLMGFVCFIAIVAIGSFNYFFVSRHLYKKHINNSRAPLKHKDAIASEFEEEIKMINESYDISLFDAKGRLSSLDSSDGRLTLKDIEGEVDSLVTDEDRIVVEELKSWSRTFGRGKIIALDKDEALEELKRFSARINSPEYKLKIKEQEELSKRLAPRSK